MEAQEIGSHIGQYRIVRKIGMGGMGTVFVGEHILLERRAAIKTLLPLLSAKPEIVERFFREARATSAINDPGVVQIYDFGYHVDGTAYTVMELLEGEALSARLERLGRLPAEAALRIARQVAGALAAAHAAGVVHRDLKPENIFLTKDAEAQGGERAKLLDFGICKVEGDDVTKTDAGVMLGTPVYMSPEQCQGRADVDGRADVYSLGCVLFQSLTGRVPFDHDSHGDLIVAHLQHVAPAPSEVARELSPLIDEIVAHCLAKDPAERFQTMHAVQSAIDSVLPQLTPAPASSGPVAVPLGAGFKSEFDGNARPITPAERNEARWFHATPLPTDPGLRESRRSWRTLAGIVLAAAVVALVGVRLMQEGDNADRKVAVTQVLQAAAHGRAMFAMTVPRDARPPAPPPAPVATTDPPLFPAKLPPIEATPPVPEVVTAPEPPPETKPAPPAATRRPVRPQRPTVRRDRPTPPPPPPPTNEDLYETR